MLRVFRAMAWPFRPGASPFRLPAVPCRRTAAHFQSCRHRQRSRAQRPDQQCADCGARKARRTQGQHGGDCGRGTQASAPVRAARIARVRGVLLVIGAPGAGKTSLLEALANELERERIAFGALESEQLAWGYPLLPRPLGPRSSKLYWRASARRAAPFPDRRDTGKPSRSRALAAHARQRSPRGMRPAHPETVVERLVSARTTPGSARRADPACAEAAEAFRPWRESMCASTASGGPRSSHSGLYARLADRS